MKNYLLGILTVVMIILILFGVGFFQIEFGRCTSSDGDGKLYNGEPYYNYISYRCMDSVSENDIVITISVNDINKECMWRWDRVILRNS